MLNILLIEDAAADAELITRELRASGLCFALNRVDTESAFRHELETCLPDLVLSNHGLPSFSGFKALEIARADHPGLAFIFVSNSNDPSLVAQMYEAGATDYVFKHDLADLRSAVLQALGSCEHGGLDPRQSDTSPAQSELSLEFPAAMPDSSIAQDIGWLCFCPRCRKLRDSAGRQVAMEDYGCTCADILVHQEVCARCG